MKIISVRINGFRSFNNFHLKFKGRENVIVGTNGTGKTNLLDIINTVLSNNFRDLIHHISEKKCTDIEEKYVEIELEFPNMYDEFNNIFVLRTLAPILISRNFSIRLDEIID